MTKIIVLLILVSIDIISKRIVFNFIDLYNFIPIFFFLDLTHIHNFGVSFGFLSGYVSSWLLVIIGLFVVAFIYYLMVSSKDLFEQWGLFVIISGALANILDRMINGYVIDFIYFNFNNYYWPAFNFADICITIGIIMIIINMIRQFKFNK